MSKEKTPFDNVYSALKKIQKLASSEAKRTKKRMNSSQHKNKTQSDYDLGLDTGSYEQASAMEFQINKIISQEL